MTDSYSAEKKIEQVVVNDQNPSMTTIDILASLKSINHFQSIIDGKRAQNTPLTGAEMIAQHELKYLSMGANAIGSDGIWRERFGGGLQGAMAMSELLKARESERVTKKLLDDQLGGTDTLDAAVAKTRGGGIAVRNL